MFGAQSRLVTGGPAQPALSGPDIDEVQTDVLGFMSLGEDAKVRLLPKPWPADKLPRPTSQLFGVASTAGLVAAADPDTLIIGSTESVRQTFSKQGSFENNFKPFDAQLKINIGTRLSHVVFSSDDEYLVLCAEDGGGLQVYKTAALKQGNTQHAFQAATGGIAVRALLPNPVEGRFFAVVLGDGKLVLAEFNQSGSSAELKPMRAGGVSCVSWSAKGKQLVAGLEDGTIVQLKPDGTQVVAIPKPPQLEAAAHVATITWLDNDTFLVTYNPNNFESGAPPESASFIIRRSGKDEHQQFEFSKFGFEPSPAFGMNRVPPHHFVQRIRDYEPNLKDALIISNTCSSDIGVVTKYAAPLSPESLNIIDRYTMVNFEDTRRAVLPDNPDNMDNPNTSPIGSAIDLSSSEPVKRPLPKEENLDSTGPLPAFMVLNNEGILSAWWFIHNAAIMQNAQYKRLNVAGGNKLGQSTSSQTTPATPFGASGSAFGTPAPSLGGAPKFGQPAAFGQPSLGAGSSPAFGQPAFGQASQPAFGKPAFGSTSAIGAGAKTFGGNANSGASPFASVNQGGSSGSPFSAFSKQSTASPFATAGANTSAASPFGSVGKTEGSLFGAQKPGASNGSAFGSAGNAQAPGFGFGPQSLKAENSNGLKPGASFGSTMTIGSTLGSNSFGVQSTLGSKTPWGTPSLSNNPSDATKAAPTQQTAQDDDMNMDRPDSMFDQGMSGLNIAGVAKQAEESKAAPKSEPASAVKAEPAPLPPDPSATKADPPLPPSPVPAAVRTEPEDAPLPPDPTPAKKAVEDAPLPPDPTPSKTKEQTSVVEDAPLPPDPAPLPPSPKSPKKEEDEAQTPFKTPIKMEQTKPSLLPPSQASTATTPAQLTPTVDFGGASDKLPPSPVGSEPVDLGAESFDSPTRSQLPDDDDTGNVAAIGTWPRSKMAPSWGFSQQSPAPKQQTEQNTPVSLFSPDTTKKDKGATPFTATPPVFFKPPQAASDSPRSPSPVRIDPVTGRRVMTARRSGSSPLRSGSRSPDRSTSTPLPPPSISQPQQRSATPKLASVVESPVPARQQAQPSNPRFEDLNLDERQEEQEQEQRAQLQEGIEPTFDLGRFEAHADYVGHITSTGLASQIERVYRDIDSMVDTLGWNARTMSSFIKGHTENDNPEGRERADLEPENWDSWVLIELPNLHDQVKDLGDVLESGRPQDLRQTHATCNAFRRDLAQLERTRADTERTIADMHAAHDSTARSSTPRARLSAEQSDRLAELRKLYARVQESLSQAEDAASLLRAKLVAATADPSMPKQVPTVEAVLNTIAKMTRLAEQKRGDVDLIDAQVRRLRRERRLRESGSSLDDALGFSALSIGGGDSPSPTPPSSARARAAAARRSIAAAPTSSPLAGRRSVRASASPGAFAVPSDSSSSDGEPHDVDDAEEAHLRAQLRRQRERLAKSRPAARVSRDDVLDWRVERRQADRVLATLRAAVAARHQAQAQAQVQHDG